MSEAPERNYHDGRGFRVFGSIKHPTIIHPSGGKSSRDVIHWEFDTAEDAEDFAIDTGLLHPTIEFKVMKRVQKEEWKEV